MVTRKDIKDLLPSETLGAPTLHRIKINTDTFKALEAIRKRERLWDREAAIIWALKKCGEWIE